MYGTRTITVRSASGTQVVHVTFTIGLERILEMSPRVPELPSILAWVVGISGYELKADAAGPSAHRA